MNKITHDIKLYRLRSGFAVERDGKFYSLLGSDWDGLLNRDDLRASILRGIGGLRPCEAPSHTSILPPIGSQEVWAAGVTYLRSRDARMEESKDSAGGSCYDKVYEAARPELFFKATPHRVVQHGKAVFYRSDSKWSVPEPELALFINSAGQITGYTIGNDMSCRDIEGENPLYLPQAKVYSACCALGPGLLLSEKPLPLDTPILMEIRRHGRIVFQGATALSQMKRSFEELRDHLFKDNTFPRGCYLLTGTGIVPPPNFTLQRGDSVSITIPPIGTLVNPVLRADLWSDNP